MNPRIVLVLFTLLFFVGACQSPKDREEWPHDGRLMGAVFQTLDNPFFRECNAGIQEIVESHGDRLITLDSQWDNSKQQSSITGLINQKVSAIFINPVQWDDASHSLLEARKNNVPCVIVDAPVKEKDLVVCQVTSDNFEAGRLAARALVKACKPARIVILTITSNKASSDRIEGFKAELLKWPEMRILHARGGKGTTQGARLVMHDLIKEYPDLNAVFAINDPMALGVISALESTGRLDGVTVVSVDGSAAGIAAIKARKLYATSVQFPRAIGRIAAQRLYEHLDGNPVEKNIKVPLELITTENVTAFTQDP